MSTDLKPLLARLARGDTLPAGDAATAFEAMMEGAASPAQIGAFLMALRVRGETPEEIIGAARVMRAKATTIAAPADAIDVCGTGGDGAGTVNISTCVSFVVAACGVPVAKHGNRAASSRSGAADVLAALGVDLDAELTTVQQCLREVGIAFLMAPRHHQAMRHVAPIRADLGTRTIFNLLGPLANPAGAKRQLIGVFDRQWLRPMAEALKALGCERAWVVHGADGLDELTVTGESHVAALGADGSIAETSLSPEQAGLARHPADALRGGTPEENAAALRAVLDGAPGAYRDIVLLNSAAALMVADKAADLAQGAALAAEAVDSGRARDTLARFVALSRSRS